jgi:hypothetical protein
MQRLSCGHSRASTFPWSGQDHPHDVPPDGRIRIEEPFEMRGSPCDIIWVHWFPIKNSV